MNTFIPAYQLVNPYQGYKMRHQNKLKNYGMEKIKPKMATYLQYKHKIYSRFSKSYSFKIWILKESK